MTNPTTSRISRADDFFGVVGVKADGLGLDEGLKGISNPSPPESIIGFLSKMFSYALELGLFLTVESVDGIMAFRRISSRIPAIFMLGDIACF